MESKKLASTLISMFFLLVAAFAEASCTEIQIMTFRCGDAELMYRLGLGPNPHQGADVITVVGVKPYVPASAGPDYLVTPASNNGGTSYRPLGGANSALDPQKEEIRQCKIKADNAKSTCYEAYRTLNNLCKASSALLGRGAGWLGGKVIKITTGAVDPKLYEAVKSAGTFTGFEADILSSSCSDLDSRATNYCESGSAKMISQNCK